MRVPDAAAERGAGRRWHGVRLGLARDAAPAARRQAGRGLCGAVCSLPLEDGRLQRVGNAGGHVHAAADQPPAGADQREPAAVHAAGRQRGLLPGGAKRERDGDRLRRADQPGRLQVHPDISRITAQRFSMAFLHGGARFSGPRRRPRSRRRGTPACAHRAIARSCVPAAGPRGRWTPPSGCACCRPGGRRSPGASRRPTARRRGRARAAA